KLEPKGGPKINEDEIKWIISPYDEFAVEEAIQLKEKESGSEVVAVSLGSPKAIETIRKALAMGADRGIHISTEDFLDHHMVATALAKAIQNDGEASIIFMGKQAIDDDSYQIHIRVAHQLNASVATNVSSFSYQGGADSVNVESEIEEGAKEKIELKIPAVVAVTKGINTPRYPSLPNIMKAKRKEVKTLDLTELGITDIANHEEILNLSEPQEKTGGKIIRGEYQDTVPQLAKLLKDEAKIF
ncbi:MAG: electron transfer flavoprotein subunit beta/FixA family protein, partial [Chitinispirillia bacterium]